MQTKLSPIHYGRYVDDVLLVLRGTNRLNSPQKIVAHLIDRVPLLREADEGMKIEPAYAAKSRLRFNSAKLHTFYLTPVAGEDLLDTIQRRIQDVSSEWRLLPDPDEMDSSCRMKLIKGQVTMEVEDALSDQDKVDGYILTCQAKVQGDVELDV